MGAGIMCAESAPQLDACLFDSNRATLWGGGICADGAYEHRPSVRHCTFTRNSAHRGGALLANDEVRPIVEHCTFYGCGADDGMIAVLSDASLRVANSIVSFAPRSEPFHLQFGTATIEHCVIFGSAAGDSLPPGNPDNIFIDPLFCDVYHDDFTLCENSPCLAANNAWGEPVGAHAVGCAECTTKVQAATWGRIKAMYR
jgi:predicted outer membrane repeat protein